MKRDDEPRGGHAPTAAWIQWVAVLSAITALASGCSSMSGRKGAPDLSNIPDAVPQVEPKSPYGNPESYVVFGRRYHTLDSSKGYVARGLASWYGPKFDGRRTSSGEPYDMYAMTAAHKTLPLPTYARVTNMENGRSAIVKVNDRGPFYGDRIIDLSYAAASKLGVVDNGTAMVEVRAINPTRPQGEENLFVSTESAGGTRDASPAAGPLTPAVAAVAARGSERSGAVPAGTSSPRSERDAGGRRAVPGADARFTQASRRSTWEARKTDHASEPKVAAAVLKTTPKAAHKGKMPPRLAASEHRAEAAAGSGKHAPQKAALAVAEAPAHGADATSGLYLQVGAFGEKANAEQLRRRLVQHLAEHVLVRTSNGTKVPLYKVHIGPLDSRKEAASVSHQLAALGLTQSHVVVE
jgi:rare lipoprotein A